MNAVGSAWMAAIARPTDAAVPESPVSASASSSSPGRKAYARGARPADGSLTEVVRHVEGESAAHPRRQGSEGDQVGRLFVLSRWAPRLADDDLAPVASDDDRGVEVAVSRARMRPGRLHIQSGNGGGGQRG